MLYLNQNEFTAAERRRQLGVLVSTGMLLVQKSLERLL